MSKNTVADMVELLKTLPQEHVIVQAKDAEGNGFSPWSGAYHISHYEATSTWDGEIVDPDEPDLGSADGFYYDEEEREQYRQLPQVVVLWPVN